MNQNVSAAGAALPKAKIKSSRWSSSFFWIVPVLAALVAGYLVYQRVHEFGTTITILFRKADGIKNGQTTLQYRGVNIGEVSSVELSKDQQHAVVKVKLKRFAAAVARAGSLFRIVRAEFGPGNITGLGTIITGPHIEVVPGNGRAMTEFVGVESSAMPLEPHGLKLTLLCSHASSLQAGAPVYYRGIEVGAVQQSNLSTDAMAVEISIIIRERYAPLVRSGSKFWNVTGLEVKLGLFRGAEINMESLKSLIIGGVAFATPEDSRGNGPAQPEMTFRLFDEPQKEWLEWCPAIMLPPADESESDSEHPPERVPALPWRGSTPL